MVQKVLGPRARGAAHDSHARADHVEVEVDQVALVRAPAQALGAAVAAGLKKTSVELAVAYDGTCVNLSPSLAGQVGGAPSETRAVAGDLLARGVLVARAGVGFPAPVHLERFASPARLCVTDEPRLAGLGGIGMLTLVVPTASLARALAGGTVVVRQPVSIQVVLSGRLRPFVCARDVAFELLRRGLGETVRRVERARGAPVVVEIGGAGVRGLSVAERSVIAAVAPQVGAAAAVFVSDERTEVFLRDQRRSKAHRPLFADSCASIEEVVSIDLGAVDPLLLDESGAVHAVRDFAGRPLAQVFLGGDTGVTLRDLFAVATLLKSKRVPSRLDFLVAVPSRQMLEVLAAAGALTDLVATGARLVEPDARVLTGEMYAPPSSLGGGAAASLRTFDPEPGGATAAAAGAGEGRRAHASLALAASPETIAYGVATGVIGDPRAFKRPVRVTLPRTLPTDDVLVARKPDRAPGPVAARPSGRLQAAAEA